MEYLNLPRKLTTTTTTTTTKNTMGIETLTTEPDFYLVKKLFGMIHIQFAYEKGELSQEMINRIEYKWRGFTWTWETIPTNLFMSAVQDLKENPDLLQTYKNILKDSIQEELDDIWSMVFECVGMQYEYIDGKLSKETIKEVEEQYDAMASQYSELGLWSCKNLPTKLVWKTLPTRIVVAALNDMLYENSINF